MASQYKYAVVTLPLLFGCAAGSSDGQVQSPEDDSAPTMSPYSEVLQHPGWDQAVEGWAEQLAAHVSDEDVGGIAAGIVVGGDLVWVQGFGWADKDVPVRMEPGAVFRAGSISRVVTAMLLMRLVDQGVIGLDDPVLRYIPEFANVQNSASTDPEVTFRHLASHTAGLARNYREGLVAPTDEWQDRVIQSFDSLFFDTVPGERYQDSPIGYGALGLALERAGGRPFMELVQREVFDPLGMTNSSFVVEGSGLEASLATAYPNRKDGTLVNSATARRDGGWGYTVPSGGLYSTVGDLGHLLGSIAGVPSLSILSESSRDEMISAQTPGGLNPPREPGVPTWGPRRALFKDGAGGTVLSPEVLDAPHGLGLSIQSGGNGSRIVHNGGIIAGYTAYVAVDPETRIGVVILRNYWRGETDLRHASVDLVAYLSGLVKGPSRIFDSLRPILIGLAVALLAGVLFGRFLKSLNA